MVEKKDLKMYQKHVASAEDHKRHAEIVKRAASRIIKAGGGQGFGESILKIVGKTEVQ